MLTWFAEALSRVDVRVHVKCACKWVGFKAQLGLRITYAGAVMYELGVSFCRLISPFCLKASIERSLSTWALEKCLNLCLNPRHFCGEAGAFHL